MTTMDRNASQTHRPLFPSCIRGCVSGSHYLIVLVAALWAMYFILCRI